MCSMGGRHCRHRLVALSNLKANVLYRKWISATQEHMYFNLKTTETNLDVAKYQPQRLREGTVFLPKCEKSFSCSRHIRSSEWAEVCSLGPAVPPGSLNTLVHPLVVTPETEQSNELLRTIAFNTPLAKGIMEWGMEGSEARLLIGE